MRKGFTLIELMIVVSIIALIAAYSIPALLRARMTANESGAIAGLRSLVANQAQFQGVGIVDQDNDGTGEYGLFVEMAGQSEPRADQQGNSPAKRRPGEFMAQLFGQTDANGFASKSGYLYQMHLPGAAPYNINSVDTSITDPADAGDPDDLAAGNDEIINEQENYWMCYAWPVARGRSSNRCFIVNVDGTIYQMTNDASAAENYSGTADVPAAGAAFIGDENDDLAYPNATQGETGADGNRWVPVSN